VAGPSYRFFVMGTVYSLDYHDWLRFIALFFGLQTRQVGLVCSSHLDFLTCAWRPEIDYIFAGCCCAQPLLSGIWRTNLLESWQIWAAKADRWHFSPRLCCFLVDRSQSFILVKLICGACAPWQLLITASREREWANCEGLLLVRTALAWRKIKMKERRGKKGGW
jgi:hypothetical protein